jgi:glycosyltransferase involved in cell wall biosynthesis
MHILHCYKTALPLTIGGAEQVIHHIAKGCIPYGLKSTVIAFAPQKKIDEFDYHGYRVIVVPFDFEYASTPVSFKGIAIFKELCRSTDIIHYHYPYPWMDILHLFSNTDKVSVLTYHSDIVKQKYLSKIYHPIKNTFLNQMSEIIYTSPYYIDRSLDLQKFRSKSRCIPLGLDEENYLPILDENIAKWSSQLPARFLLFIGVFRYYKGLNYLFEALKDLDIPIVLIGDGPEKENLKKLEKRHKLKNIYFLGELGNEDKNAILKLSSGVVLPSYLKSEAFGLSLVEGAMFGKPLISCEIGTGTSYINLHLKTGWVVPPADILALKTALQEWHINQQLSEELGRNARLRYEKLFRSERMVSKYIELYKQYIEV